MQPARRQVFQPDPAKPVASHIEAGAVGRAEVENFIREVFARHYGARVSAFAPNLLMLQQRGRIVAATGWRNARCEPLFLERYLDAPIEQLLSQLANQPVRREHIVEVGNLAADMPGGSPQVIMALASHLDRHGYDWVVFTATRELIRIFTRLGLPLLALAKADPARLGEAASDWGSYYETEPIVVAGLIDVAMDRIGRHA